MPFRWFGAFSCIPGGFDWAGFPFFRIIHREAWSGMEFYVSPILRMLIVAFHRLAISEGCVRHFAGCLFHFASALCRPSVSFFSWHRCIPSILSLAPLDFFRIARGRLVPVPSLSQGFLGIFISPTSIYSDSSCIPLSSFSLFFDAPSPDFF